MKVQAHYIVLTQTCVHYTVLLDLLDQMWMPKMSGHHGISGVRAIFKGLQVTKLVGAVHTGWMHGNLLSFDESIPAMLHQILCR